jgi:hypothetical protein
MLCNNLDPECGEKTDELIAYGGTGRAARNWPCFDAIVRYILDLENDETLLVQSGKPVGVLKTHAWSPRVLIANSNLVPRWADWEHFHGLERKGLMMYGQMTAGSWIYIGTQGILQGTYETLASLAQQHFGGSLRGRITVSGGLGGMGGAQPLAVTLNEGVFIGVEVDRLIVEEMLPAVVRQGIARFCEVFCEEGAFTLDQSRRILEAAREAGLGIKIHADEISRLGGSTQAAEGLALVKGTQVTTAIGGLAVYDALNLSRLADIAAAMSLEVLLGSRTEFHPRIHELRPHPGQAAAADNMRRMIQNSEIMSSHKDCGRIQDAYTLRCSPQVHGASKDAIAYVRRVLETEMNSSTNNPLILADSGEFLLGGNFHGQPVGLALDFLCMAVAELANISERRIERLVNPQLSGLPAFLVQDGGLNSGFMIAQYTAAALVSENKVLSHPACVDSIPTSANREDHVPMSPISARKARDIVRNAEHVIAIELLCSAQGLDLFTNLKPGEGTLAAYRTIRGAIPHLERARVLSRDIERMVRLMRSGKLLEEVEATAGILR